jgi:HEAT repeat protein
MRHPHFLTSALTNCLHHTNVVIRVEALNALRRIGERARPTIPAMREALDDRETAVKEAATNALEKIAPEVLTNGVKEF